MLFDRGGTEFIKNRRGSDLPRSDPSLFYLDSTHSTLLFVMNTRCAEVCVKAFDEIFAEFDQLVSFSFPSHEFCEYLKGHFLNHYRKWMLSIHRCMEPFVIN